MLVRRHLRARFSFSFCPSSFSSALTTQKRHTYLLGSSNHHVAIHEDSRNSFANALEDGSTCWGGDEKRKSELISFLLLVRRESYKTTRNEPMVMFSTKCPSMTSGEEV